MALHESELNALVIPESVFVKEIYTKTPGWRVKHNGYNFVELVNQVVAEGGSGLFSTMSDNSNGTYTFNPPSGSSILVDTRAISNPVTVTATNIPSTNTNVQIALEYLHNNVANTQSALGITFIPADGLLPTFGSFTGWTITDDQALKPILQELEIYTQDAVHAASNGLTKVSGTSALSESLVKLGGTLTEDTQIRAGAFEFDIRNSGANLKIKSAPLSTALFGAGESAMYSEAILGTTTSVLGVRNSLSDVVPFLYREDSVSGRAQLIELLVNNVTLGNVSNANLNQSLILGDSGITSRVNNNAAGTEAVYSAMTASAFRIGTVTATPPATTEFYDLPVVDGAAGEVLTTDGLGAVSWAPGSGGGGLSNEFVTLQEFLTFETVVNRTGESFFIVPSSLNGYELEGYEWSVYIPGTATFDIDLNINGSTVAGTTANVGVAITSGSITFSTITLSAGDRISITTSNVSNVLATASGLAIAFELLKP